MKLARIISSALLLLLISCAASKRAPAQGPHEVNYQAPQEVNYQVFYDELSPYGT